MPKNNQNNLGKQEVKHSSVKPSKRERKTRKRNKKLDYIFRINIISDVISRRYINRKRHGRKIASQQK